MKRIATITAVAAGLAGCATASKDVATTYVSPIQYQNYDCDQLATESQRLTTRVQQVGARLDEAASNDKAITGAGLILFWPALFALGGTKQQEAEYARLKGEAEAIQQAAVARKCAGLMVAPAPTASSPVQTAAAASDSTQCVTKGRREGDRFTVPGEGEYVIKRVLPTAGSNCHPSWHDTVIASRATQGPAVTPVALPALAPATATARPVADRLRDLKKLRDDNLITQEVYDAKQREILNGQ